MMRRFLLGFAVAAALVPFAASAQEGCYIGPVSAGESPRLQLMRVVGDQPRVYFLEEKSKQKPYCPNAQERCQRKAFLVPGDEVVAGPVQPDGLVCVTYISPNAKKVKGVFAETNGYLPTQALVVSTPPSAPAQAWLGTWTRTAEGEIDITQSGSKLRIAGQAFLGSNDPQRVKMGNVRTGELDGEATPRGAFLGIGEKYDGTKPLDMNDQSDCKARLQLVGRYLVALDNLQCGGMGVSFTGIYVRLK